LLTVKASFAVSILIVSALTYLTALNAPVARRWRPHNWLIQEAGQGVIIWLDQEGKGNGHLALIQSSRFKENGSSQADSYLKAGFEADARRYHAAANILTDLRIRSIVLLANNPDKVDELRKVSITVSDTKRIT
jgi:GTP cyclohydrolase II